LVVEQSGTDPASCVELHERLVGEGIAQDPCRVEAVIDEIARVEVAERNGEPLFTVTFANEAGKDIRVVGIDRNDGRAAVGEATAALDLPLHGGQAVGEIADFLAHRAEVVGVLVANIAQRCVDLPEKLLLIIARGGEYAPSEGARKGMCVHGYAPENDGVRIAGTVPEVRFRQSPSCRGFARFPAESNVPGFAFDVG